MIKAYRYARVIGTSFWEGSITRGDAPVVRVAETLESGRTERVASGYYHDDAAYIPAYRLWRQVFQLDELGAGADELYGE